MTQDASGANVLTVNDRGSKWEGDDNKNIILASENVPDEQVEGGVHAYASRVAAYA